MLTINESKEKKLTLDLCTDVETVTIESQATTSPVIFGTHQRMSSGSSRASHPSHDSSSNKAPFQVPVEDRSKYEKFVDDFDEKRSSTSSSSSDSLSGNSDIVESRVSINNSLLGYPETDQLLIPPCPGSVTGSSCGSRPDDDDDCDSIGSACDILGSEVERDSDSEDHDEEIVAVVHTTQNDQLFVGHLEGSKHLLSDTDCCTDSDDGGSHHICAQAQEITAATDMIALNSCEQDLDAEVERNLLCQVIRDEDQGNGKQQDLFGSKPFTESSANVTETGSIPTLGQDLFGAAPFSLLDASKECAHHVMKPPVAAVLPPRLAQNIVVLPTSAVLANRSREPTHQVTLVEAGNDHTIVRRKSSAEAASVSLSKVILSKKKDAVKKKLKQDPKKKELTQSDEEEVDGLLKDDDDEDGAAMMATSGLKSKEKKKTKVKDEKKKEEKVKEKKKDEKVKEKKEEKKKDEKVKEKKEEKKKDEKKGKKKEEKKSSKRDKSRDATVHCSGFANLSFEDQTEEDRISKSMNNRKET